MMRGLLVRAAGDSWRTAAVFAVALAVVERLLMFVLPQLQQTIGGVLATFPIARPVLSGLLGMPVGDGLSATLLQSILWVHPVVLALVWGFAVVLCTRFPAGEIDRGTVDVLLGLPASRRGVYVAETLVCLVFGAAIIAIGSIGYFAGAAALPPDGRPAATGVVLVMVNLFCVFASVSGVGFLVSALSDRRGRAIAVIFGILLASFLLNVLAEFWPPAERAAFLGVLHYYQPARVMAAAALNLRDVTVLLGVGAAAWIAGGEIVARRSIRTV
jgi:ABC-type transport system involved in multi-copper enzyme maturation permease subunit